MRRAAAPRWIEGSEVLVAEDRTTGTAQCGQEPLVVQQVVTEDVGVPEQTLIVSIASHEVILWDQFTSRVDFRPPN